MSLSFKDQLIKGIINYPILYIPHFHRNYIINEVEDVCRQLELDKIRVIDCSEKDILVEPEGKKKTSYNYYEQSIKKLAQYYRNIEESGSDTERAPNVCVVCEANKKLLEDPTFVALLNEHVQKHEQEYGKNGFINRTLILCVPSCELPPRSISSISYVIPIQPPCESEIIYELKKTGLSGSEADELMFARALQGLHLYDIKQIISFIKNEYGTRITHTSVKYAQKEKEQLIRKTGILEAVEPDISLEDVGGLNKLRANIKRTANLYKHLDILQKAKVPIPKGFLLIGMPGCGKSMIAKATAKEFGCPLLKLDMGKLLGKYVGDSEHNLQLALDVVDSAHPCVLWIDEIEKAFAGTNNSSGDGDDVMMRLMGKFLSWMQERKTAVFIMATANDVLKPELMRKGRFDEVYFVDFPSAEEAIEIINNTIGKYDEKNIGKPLKEFFTEQNISISKVAKDITSLEEDKDSHIKHGLSGAEIKALFDTFVADSISDLVGGSITNNQADKVNLKNISFRKEFFEDTLNKAKKSAMIKQMDSEDSFINKLYELKDKYHLTPASEYLWK